jgi:hypothetical protein
MRLDLSWLFAKKCQDFMVQIHSFQFPKVIIDANKIDSGNTNGIIRGIENSKNLIINDISKSYQLIQLNSQIGRI